MTTKKQPDPRQTFRTLRQSLKLSQAAAARAIGVTVTSVEHWESGRRPTPQYAINSLTLIAKLKTAGK